jgi:hypothetical protein
MSYVEVPIVNTSLVALVDAADARRVLRHTWHLSALGYPERWVTRGGRKRKQSLGRYLLDPPRGVHVRYRSDDRLDCTRANLVTTGGAASVERADRRGRLRVEVSVDNRTYFLGRWPRAFASDVRELASECAVALRGLGLSPYVIQRELDLACGRAVPDTRTAPVMIDDAEALGLRPRDPEVA